MIINNYKIQHTVLPYKPFIAYKPCGAKLGNYHTQGDAAYAIGCEITKAAEVKNGNV